MVTGWCPVHDKVYEADDGLCPRCGSALVVEDQPVPTAIAPEERTAGDGGAAPGTAGAGTRWNTRLLGAVAAVVAAFGVGLAFPKGGSGGGTQPIRAPDAAADHTLGASRTGAGLTLRLESFTQRGRLIVARVTVQGGPAAEDLMLGALRGASVSVRTTGGSESVAELAARTTVSGFVLEGPGAPRADTAVAGLRIESLNLGAGSSADVSLDLRGAWPATATTQPRSRPLAAALKPADGPPLQVEGVVGWSGRLEFGVAIPGERPGWEYRREFSLRRGPTEISGTLLGGPGAYVLSFPEPPREAREVTLQVVITGLSISGGWEWSLG